MSSNPTVGVYPPNEILALQNLLADAEAARIAAEKKASDAKAALERAQEVNESLKRRLNNKHQKGQTVYILRNPADRERKLYKIGHSKDVCKRNGTYSTAMPDGVDTIHRVQTCDANLVERVVHHVLDAYRYDANREWFQGDAELFRRVLDAVVSFVDGLTSSLDNVTEARFDERVKKVMRCLQHHGEGGNASDSSTRSAVTVNTTGDGNTIHVNVVFQDDTIKAFFKERFQRDVNPDRVAEWRDVFGTYKRLHGRIRAEDLKRGLQPYGLVWKQGSVGGKKFEGYRGWNFRSS
jgi:T5orf172 domain-containing protein